MKDRRPAQYPGATTLRALGLLLFSASLFGPAVASLSAQACLGESPLAHRSVSLTAGVAVSEELVPGVSARTALPGGFAVGAGWNRLDPDGEVSRGNNDVPSHDVWSGVAALELELGSGELFLCPFVRLARGEWSRTEPHFFHPGTSTDTETTTILAAGASYALRLPLEGEWVPALFARAEVQRHWVTEEEVSRGDGDIVAYTDTRSARSTEFMSRLGVLLPWERWAGSAWIGIGTDDERPMVPHAAGDLVFGMSLGVAF